MGASKVIDLQEYRLRGLSVTELAEKVVGLIEKDNASDLEEVERILHRFYSGDSARAARAYEVACMVALKRAEARYLIKELEPVRPAADRLVLRASEAVARGRHGEAFSLLREASLSGARKGPCRRVVFQLLKALPERDRESVLVYTPRAMVSLTVGRVRNAGLVVVEDPAEWLRERRDLPWRSLGEGRVFLRDARDLEEDQREGRLEAQCFKFVPVTFRRMNWRRYFLALTRTRAA